MWVNTQSHIYHEPGSKFYGKTKQGKYVSEQEAIARMKNDAFQEEGEAVGKWKRARLGSTQLSTYYVGNAEMNDIRAAWEKNHGKYPDLRSLHDAMLSFGNAAPKYVRERLGM